MTLRETIEQDPQGLIARAYAFAKQAHKGQKRKTGEPYFVHAEATGEILLLWRLDEETVAAGILHDTVEDTEVTLDTIRKEFGGRVAFLVDGVTKLGRIKYRGAEAQSENMRKLIMAITKDLRVIFIKLADRLHNMNTLDALPPAKQKRIALETDEIYALLAYRLGMKNVSGELHDIAFHYLEPEKETWVKKLIAEKYDERLSYVTAAQPLIEAELKKQNLRPIAIEFRAKRYSSLYRKLERHNMDIESIFDLVAMRIIVETAEQCYGVLGVVHSLWPPLPGRIKDYIAVPKHNGYRSLHTTVRGPENKVLEIQIRTIEMHEENEYGIPAHIFYKEKPRLRHEKLILTNPDHEFWWVKRLREWQEKYGENSDPEILLHEMKVDLFKNRIFVITPRGDAIELPAGATPVDFAYEIHGALGDSCVAAKVNSRFVSLDSELHSGDFVEILTQKNKKPSEDWLKFVKTSKSRAHIKAALKSKKQILDTKRPKKKK
jgi:GTP diphosphokinase / guanosine-3',5'-bis(diphosphate) 3'-diphosphatase